MRWTGLVAVAVFGLCIACNSGTTPVASSTRTSSVPTAGGPTAPADTSRCSGWVSAPYIQGSVGYPGDVQEALTVYALSTDGKSYSCVEMAGFGRLRNAADAATAKTFRLGGLTPGDYYVLTAVRDLLDPLVKSASRHFDAAYTKAVQCGLSAACSDHSLVAVHLDSGTTLTGIVPGDWYAPPNAFPLIPGGGPPIFEPAKPASLESDGQAALYFLQLHTSARAQGCPTGEACLVASNRGYVGAEGHDAWYYIFDVGTNAGQDGGVVMTCTVYLSRATAGYDYFDMICRHLNAVFPAAYGAQGHIALGFGETGCVNVHVDPSLTARVVACLPDGTAVTLNGGPYFVRDAPPTADFGTNYWWSVEGKGWVVHRYLMYSP